ncbi:DUF502 domain-containing protein [Elusimicrobiota bacterium]
MGNFKLDIKKNIITGIITILPLLGTFYIVWIIFSLVSSLAIPFLKPFVKLFFGKDEVNLLLRLVSFILTIAAIWLTGVFATQIVSKRIIHWLEGLLARLPFVNSIYKAFRQFMNYFSQTKNFKSVAMVQFPREGSYALGFVTGKIDIKDRAEVNVKVFVPTSPTPTTGFLIFVREQDLIHISISVDEAVRAIISGGIVMPDLNKRIPDLNDKKN